MSEGPLGGLAELVRALALLVLVGLAVLMYWKWQSPPSMDTAPRGFDGELPPARDAGVPAPVTYGPTLSHAQPSTPPVIDGRMAGIYVKRDADCHEAYVATQGHCVHRSVHDDPRGATCLAAFQRGVAPPGVSVRDGGVLWPTTIQYERVDMVRGSYNTEGNGRTRSSDTALPRSASSNRTNDDELQRLQHERLMRESQERAVRDQRRAAATREAETARSARDRRWRDIQRNY